MKKLIEQRYVIRQNLLTIIGFCLFCYFSYHAAFGERSYIKLLVLEHKVEKIAKTHNTLKNERVALEKKVKMMRPGSVDRDLLEERARFILGYGYDDEHIILMN